MSALSYSHALWFLLKPLVASVISADDALLSRCLVIFYSHRRPFYVLIMVSVNSNLGDLRFNFKIIQPEIFCIGFEFGLPIIKYMKSSWLTPVRLKNISSHHFQGVRSQGINNKILLQEFRIDCQSNYKSYQMQSPLRDFRNGKVKIFKDPL